MKGKQYSTLGLNVVPSNYTLRFESNLKTFEFEGMVLIDLVVAKPTKTISLHAKELLLREASLLMKNKVLPAIISVDEKKQQATFRFSEAVVGKATLRVLFQGQHNDKMYGFYRSHYGDKGKEQYLLTTQFEAANARAAFPCFDEPAFKATFDVTLVADSGMMAISNMPVKSEKRGGARKEVTFERSPIMSTYLLYLGVGDFKSLETRSGRVLIRVLATPDKIKYGKLALGYTKTFLQFFERYFEILYPLPKLDIIAIPDFASGAMENWGAITFREIAVLGDETTSVFVKQNIAITVAHELAHQWFGNLVTMQWWDDLWLNESFATFMSYKAVHDAFPDWELPLQYFEDTIADALAADQLESTHPINVAVKTPEEIDEIFDQISYDKGGSVLHMLEHYVGDDAFRRGLARYLHNHAYKNATKDDLWGAIGAVSGRKEVLRLMKGWVTQKGYPVVHVQCREKGIIDVQQKRFSLLGKKHRELWQIPFRYATSDGVESQFLLSSARSVLKTTSPWLKANVGQHGFYRVHYDKKTLAQLGEAIKSNRLSALDAAGIENDLYSLVLAGTYSLRDYLVFVKQYCLNVKYPSNANISYHLGSLYRVTAGKPLQDDVKTLSLQFHQRLLRELGWQRGTDEKNTLTILRSMTIVNLGLMGDAAILRKANELFTQIKSGKDNVDPNLRGGVYLLAAWQGGKEEYDYLLARYAKEQVPEESRKLLRALGMFQEETFQTKALALSQSTAVRLQDSFVIPSSLAGNPQAKSVLVLRWTMKNWSMLKQKYGSGTHMLGTFVHNLSCCTTLREREQIENFFTKKENYRDDIRQALAQTLERIMITATMLEKNK